MPKSCVGIQIGASSVKMAQVTDGRIVRLAAQPLPDNLVRDGHILSVDAMAEVLRDMAKANRVSCRRAAVVLPPQETITRRVSMPYMTVDELELNLPYEFHDYMQADRSEYVYDYAVVGEQKNGEGKIESQDMLAAAVLRQTVEEYRHMIRKAGFKLVSALPECLTYRSLIQFYQAHDPQHPAEYCVIDLGHSSIQMYLYQGDVYEMTRVVEYGGGSLDLLIADRMGVDAHVAAGYKVANYENAQSLEECRDLYGKIAGEILRALNFYRYSNPASTLQDVYLTGGLTAVKPLLETIQGALEYTVHSVSELMPETAERAELAVAPAAVGAAMQ